MKIHMLGIYPPPYGGISIFIKRIIEKLDQKKITTILYNPCKENIKIILWKIIFVNSKDIIHVNFTNKKLKIIFGLYSFFFRKKIILSIHGEGIINDYEKSNYIIKKIYRFSIKKYKHIIPVNETLKKYCISLGIEEKKISVIPAYINPIKQKKDYELIDSAVWTFIQNQRAVGNRIITGNGNIRFYKNEDLYGLDMLIELMKELKLQKEKVSLVFVLLGYEEQSKEERKYFVSLVERIKKLELEKKIYIYISKNTEYYPILENTDIFIRPTNTDGYGISLVEAIFFKKISIASDVCERNKNVILFEKRNHQALFETVIRILKNFDNEMKKVKTIKIIDYSEEYIKLYKKLK